MKKAIVGLVVVTALLCIMNAPRANAGPIVFSATDFGDALWSETVVYAGGPGGAVSGWHVGSGGHTGAYRQCRISINAGGPAAVWGFHRCIPFSYDPQTQGAIDSVDYAAYLIGLPGAHNTGPAVRQNGVVYAAYGLLADDAAWTHKSLAGLTASDFQVIGGTAHPDFSSTGLAFEVGFITGYSTPNPNHGSYSVDSGIDNWTFIINPVEDDVIPEPAGLGLLGFAVLLARRRRRRS